jgi:hypothetical protein
LAVDDRLLPLGLLVATAFTSSLVWIYCLLQTVPLP